MDWLTILETALLVLGGLLVYLGNRFAAPAAVSAGVILIGLGLVTSGAETVIRRRSGVYNWLLADEGYSGLGAVLWGVAFFLAGSGTALYGAARLVGWQVRAGAFLRARPGVAILGISLALLALGAAMSVGLVPMRGDWRAILSTLPRRVFGLALGLLGLAGVGLGLLEVVAPGVYDGLWAALLAWLPRPPEIP